MIARQQADIGALPGVATSGPVVAGTSPGTASRAARTRLGACTGAAALLQLDGTLITVALPSVARTLGIASASTSIVLSALLRSKTPRHVRQSVPDLGAGDRDRERTAEHSCRR